MRPRQEDSVTPRQRDTLNIVMNYQPVTTATLAAHLGVQKNAANRYLLHLKRAGLVVADAINKNNVWYRATRQAEVNVTARQAYEQAASVWAYAARCAQGAKR